MLPSRGERGLLAEMGEGKGERVSMLRRDADNRFPCVVRSRKSTRSMLMRKGL